MYHVPPGLDGVADGQVDGGAQEERRLADRLARVHRARVLRLRQQRHAKVDRDVGEAGDFVIARPTFVSVVLYVLPYKSRLPAREQLAVGEEHRFFDGGPASALHKRALNLTNVNGRVQTLAQVHDDVGTQRLEVSCQQIHLYFGRRHAEREICKYRVRLCM